MLNQAHVAQYRAQGFAVGDTLLDPPTLAALRARMAAHIAALPPGQRPENMPSLHYDDTWLRSLFLGAACVDIAESLLGPDIALFTSYAISKRPHDGLPVAWHQDAAFFPIAPMSTFTLWLAVDASHRGNGCMQVLPGSHRARRVVPHVVDQDGGSVLPLHLSGLRVDSAVDVEIPAGGFSVHDPFLLHGSPPNISSERRCGITIKYIATDVTLDRGFVSPTGFDWRGVRLYHARGARGKLDYAQ